MVIYKNLLKKTARYTSLVAIIAIFFTLFVTPLSAQQGFVVTKKIPLLLDTKNEANNLWINPLNILDGDELTFSVPESAFLKDEEGAYYFLTFLRPMESNISELSADMGQVIKVQVKFIYSLRQDVPLSRFSYIEFEGLIKRMQNIDIPGRGFSYKLEEIFDVTNAYKNWNFADPLQWDEFVIRLASEDDYLSEGSFRLYEVFLYITFAK